MDPIGAIMHLVDAEPDAGTGCRYASALSEHPDPVQAAAEVTAEVLERLGPAPELAVLFVTPPHRDAVGDIADVVRAVLRPVTLLGAAAVAVLGARREVEQTPGVSLFAARLGSPPVPVRLVAERDGRRVADRWTSGRRGRRAVDAARRRPVHVPGRRVAWTSWEEHRPGLAVVGGLASAAHQPGGNRLVVDDSCYADGAVGLLLTDDVSPHAVVSQGCRPIGRPYIVTRADGHLIHELGGRPALERLIATLERLPPVDRHLAEQGLHCGVVIDETKVEFERGDFLIRGVLGVDRATGAVAVGDTLPVGSTVQFQVRDAASADEDLHAALVRTCRQRCARVHLQRARPPAVRHARPRRHRDR